MIAFRPLQDRPIDLDSDSGPLDLHEYWSQQFWYQTYQLRSRFRFSATANQAV